MNLYKQYIKEIVAAGQRLARQGLMTAHDGNISRRLVGGYMITASGINKGELSEDDVLCLDSDGKVLKTWPDSKSPSSESELHLALYQAYPQVSAIVHAHPPYATALAVAGKKLDCNLLEESRLHLSNVPVLEHFTAGSKELAQAAKQAAGDANALLLKGHGALTWGDNIEDAVCRMEIIEHTARVMLYKQLYMLGLGDV